jgi:hypothetical protein
MIQELLQLYFTHVPAIKWLNPLTSMPVRTPNLSRKITANTGVRLKRKSEPFQLTSPHFKPVVLWQTTLLCPHIPFIYTPSNIQSTEIIHPKSNHY